ncbi:hypothetical protein [Sulfitobacter sp.]|uniref:hypothetical protein n=1 Tax=Sulfitobacter sp. TaxID=1903071 RepID=UPI00302C0D11
MRNVIPHCELDARLRAALEQVEYPVLCEPSVKVAGGILVDGRYLVSFPRAALGPGPKGKLRQILINLDIPPEGLAGLDAVQSASRSVHFGYEPDPHGALIKCYLEFDPASRPQQDLVFIAIKWRSDGAFAKTLYLDRDALGANAQDDLLRALVPEGDVRDAMLRLADLTRDHTALRFLEVVEPGSPRRSLDINLSESGQTIGAHHDLLYAFLGGGDATQTYLRSHASDKLGHVAAGTTRDGMAFGTLYHGAHRLTSAP